MNPIHGLTLTCSDDDAAVRHDCCDDDDDDDDVGVAGNSGNRMSSSRSHSFRTFEGSEAVGQCRVQH